MGGYRIIGTTHRDNASQNQPECDPSLLGLNSIYIHIYTYKLYVYIYVCVYMNVMFIYIYIYEYSIYVYLAVLAEPAFKCCLERSHFRSRFCNCFAFSNVSSLKVLTVLGEVTLEGACLNMSREMFTAWTSLSRWILTSDFCYLLRDFLLPYSLGKAAWTSMHINLMGIPFHHEKPDGVR